MSPIVNWQDILLRLATALIAGGLIGYDRSLRGRVAGLRTTMLMCLAAAAAMIEANLMLGVTGRASDSFTRMDVLRFPLGILSGIGFIGAGAIVRRGNLVTGVTTAATLWLVTVVGLLIGAGYLLVGGVVALIAFLVLSALKGVEPYMIRQHRGHLVVDLTPAGPRDEDLRRQIALAGFTISSWGARIETIRRVECHLEWYSRQAQDSAPELVEQLSATPGVHSVEWTPVTAGHMFE